jgi:hypothetical protein
VYLTAQLEVAEHDGDLGARDDEDGKHEREETEDVIELMQPHGSENEEQLDEYRTKGKNPADEDGEDLVHVP